MWNLFDIFKSKPYKKGYFVHTVGAKNLLCKILNEYETAEEANKDLIDLVVNKKTEKDLYREFLKKKSW
ncbi:MAG: hypothetical protein PHC81_06585 [Clostridia bacterium]|nr:hypothetical protein [Clostridia bacterium]